MHKISGRNWETGDKAEELGEKRKKLRSRQELGGNAARYVTDGMWRGFSFVFIFSLFSHVTCLLWACP